MVDFWRRKSYSGNNELPQVIESSEDRFNPNTLEELKLKIDNLNLKISGLEKRMNLFFPENAERNDLLSGQSQFSSETEKLHNKLLEIEKKLDERVPEVVLSENKFKTEIQDSEELINKIVSELKNILVKKTETSEENLTIVESKRIENIKSLLKKHEKLSSTELSQLTGLSRTRSNEYFKKMENLGIVKPVLVGKEKYYKLKG